MAQKSPEETVKFMDQVRKIWGWIKFWTKGGTKVLIVFILGSMVWACDLIRIINTIPIPNPPPVHTPTPTPDPTAEPTSIPTATPTTVPTMMPTPIPTPTPVPVGCFSPNTFLDVRDGKCKKIPVLGFWKVQGFNPKQTNYNCHNPQDGPKFKDKKICVKDSTIFWCDPDNEGNCGQCDTDHPSFWNTFCHQRDWDNADGPKFHGSNVEAVMKSDENSFYTDVYFIPGITFRFCVFPPKDFKTKDGISVSMKPNTETCVNETYH